MGGLLFILVMGVGLTGLDVGILCRITEGFELVVGSFVRVLERAFSWVLLLCVRITEVLKLAMDWVSETLVAIGIPNSSMVVILTPCRITRVSVGVTVRITWVVAKTVGSRNVRSFILRREKFFVSCNMGVIVN